MKVVAQEGIRYNGVHFEVAVPDAFICDAPARAYLKCVKGHTGYYGCERCTVKGVHENRRVTFPELSAELRTDEKFRDQRYEEHQVGVSPLNELGVGLVTSFVLDYMHLVCLGAVRRLLFLWLKGPMRCRQSVKMLSVISTYMSSLRRHMPSNFARKPRSLLELSSWKATELRQFLLYTGPVVLNNVPSRIYRNFLLLSVAIRILLSSALCSPENDNYAEDILKVFVKDFALIYGNEFVSYNIHSLIHIAQDAMWMKFGPLDNVIMFCFPF